MLSMQDAMPLHQPPRSDAPFDPAQTQLPPPGESGRIIFTRQLWQRSMPIEDQREQSVLNKSQTANSQASINNASESARRTSSTVSLRSRRRSPSPSGASKTPLTPEESPPFRSTGKRSAGTVELEDRIIDSAETSPAHTRNSSGDSAHTRNSSGDSAAHVCICQPDPKIPRPRNAFILYRQHHQANVVARNPGLANPEISKIIGEQWQNETTDQKNKWKALAEEEKLRHQQQYPTYRYQPKRNGRRNSTDGSSSASGKPKCEKCSGRLTITPSAPYLNSQSNSLPATPGSTITPSTRTLPVLRDLSLQSPAARQLRASQGTNMMSANHRSSLAEERDDVGPLSPETKRRRFNGDQSSTVQRVMPPRFVAAPPGVAFGPGTPFPFTGPPPQPHAYPAAVANPRRESLPGIRGVVSPPGPMAPPPRPGMGYQQHRLSQGHIPQDRSLTLPPLQTRNASIGETMPGSGKSADEQIMSISFRYKIKVLSQVAPPAPKVKWAPRGPLIAIEGDSPVAVAELAGWLRDRLGNGEDLNANLLSGPKIAPCAGKEEVMAQYHRLAAEWLEKNKEIVDSITLGQAVEEVGDASMTDAAPATTPPQSGRKIDENYDDSDNASSSSKNGDDKMQDDALRNNSNTSSESATTERMDVDKRSSIPSQLSRTNAKPVTIIPNYSLHTCNTFARLIPIGPSDPYAPNDHWQWTATVWRGIIGPDLTIYLRDAAAGATTGPSVEIEAVEGRPEVGLFVVKRTNGDMNGESGSNADASSGGGVEASVLRRVGFEVSEWVRAFAGGKA